MRISSINYGIYNSKINNNTKRARKFDDTKEIAKNKNISSQNTNFKGIKNACLGAILGGVAGTVVTVLTAGATAPLIPEMMMVCGAIGMTEDDNPKDDE